MKFIILLIMSLSLWSCAESPDSGSNDPLKVYTLTWDAPDELENGDDITANSYLLEYRIYFGDSAGNVTQNIQSFPPTTTSATTADLDQSVIASSSTVYIAMTSVGPDGVESSLSEIAAFKP